MDYFDPGSSLPARPAGSCAGGCDNCEARRAGADERDLAAEARLLLATGAPARAAAGTHTLLSSGLSTYIGCAPAAPHRCPSRPSRRPRWLSLPRQQPPAAAAVGRLREMGLGTCIAVLRGSRASRIKACALLGASAAALPPPLPDPEGQPQRGGELLGSMRL